jgi:hypothetical protein
VNGSSRTGFEVQTASTGRANIAATVKIPRDREHGRLNVTGVGAIILYIGWNIPLNHF